MTVFTKTTFTEILRDRGVLLSEKQQEQFACYAKLLIEWNQKMNLTAIMDENEIYEKHFLDSILPFLKLDMEHLCDVGAGAGFPSLPVKIVRPRLEVTILEPLNKRVVFLQHLCAQLGLDAVHCLHERAEDHAKRRREAYDVVSARAVANLPMLSELCLPLVKPGGLFLALKGSQGEAEAQAARHAIETLGGKLERQEAYRLSDGAGRINLFYRKVRATPVSYPRSFGQIKKRPL